MAQEVKSLDVVDLFPERGARLLNILVKRATPAHYEKSQMFASY